MQNNDPSQLVKKVKRVQFQESVNIINGNDDDDDDLEDGDEEDDGDEGELADEEGYMPPRMHPHQQPQQQQQNHEVQQDHSISSTIDGSVSDDSVNTETEVLDYRIAEKIKTEMEERQKLEKKGLVEELPSTSNNPQVLEEDLEIKPDYNRMDIRKVCYDGNKAGLENGEYSGVKIEDNSDSLRIEYEEQEKYDKYEFVEDDKKIISPLRKQRKPSLNKPKICSGCNIKHGKEPCPLNAPLTTIGNKIELKEWLEQNDELIKKHKIILKPENEEGDEDNDDLFDVDDDDDDGDGDEDDEVERLDILPSFSESSLPPEFELRLAPLSVVAPIPNPPPVILPSSSNQSPQTTSIPINHGLSIYTKVFIPKYTQFGPLIGQIIQETDIQDDCNMRYIFETFDGTKSTFWNTENKNQSNWMRYLRPSRQRDQRNVVLVHRNEQIYFVSCTDIDPGCELLYWSDDCNSAWGKKKIEKTSK